MSTPSEIRVGLVGAGYIADWHADALKMTPGVRLAAVCDTSPGAAERFGLARGVPAFPSLDAMAGAVDAVHVLTPPPSHRAVTLAALAAGLHVLVEKPVGLSVVEVAEMADAARAAGRALGASHNFLGLPSYARLKRMLGSGVLGRPVELRVTWALPLAPLQSGPYGLWFLREPGALLWEIGPHPFSLACDLLGEPTVSALDVGQPVDLPGMGTRPQSWRVLARAPGGADVTIAVSLAQTHEDRSVVLRGTSGMARLDYARDTLVMGRDNAAGLLANALRREAGAGARQVVEGLRNAGRQALSLNRRGPYALSFAGTVAGFYAGVRSGVPDKRFSPGAALAVARSIEATLALLPPEAPLASPAVRDAPAPRVAVIGGTGFIGRALTRALAARGRAVRVLTRGGAGPFADLGTMVETAPVSLGDEAGLAGALRGMDVVVNLARAQAGTWEEALAGEVATTERIGRAAVAAGVGRLVHAGTIASYDMSRADVVITEETPFGEGEGRNVYARAKAEGEVRLRALCDAAGLPLVIARPGIVVGREGPLQHWGIGRWHGAGALRFWDRGDHPLPFVLVDDVAEGLILMGERGEGSFNLVGDVPLSGREYLDAIAARTGARIRAASGSPVAYWAADGAKAALKARVLGRRGVVRASLADWRSRGHASRFDNARPKALLGWRPEADREAFLRRAVDEAGLFGL